MNVLIKEIIQLIKKNSLLLKLIFIASVMFFVINQLSSILHGMTFEHFKTLLLNQGLKNVILFLFVGMISVLPMILYDYGTTKVLNIHFSLKKLINNGWIINTINNLVGFGGVVGVTFRMNKYGNLTKNKKVMPTITKTAVFMLSGLSILSFIMFCYLAINNNSPFIHYWIWLLLGSLYAPGLFLFIKFNPKNLFAEFSNKQILIFYLASLGQWFGAMTSFLFIGYHLVHQINLIDIAPLFIASTLIGMLTMVPGGMGTFDVLIILGLGTIGVSKTVAVVWILFYRVFYYIIPFISGVLLFIHQTGRKINNLLDNLPKLLINKCAHLFITAIMYFAGFMTIIMSTVPKLTLISSFFAELFPFSFITFDQTLNLMIGLLFIGLARGVYNRVRRAYDLSMIILLFCIVNTLLSRISIQFVVLYGIVLLCLYIARDEFYRQKFVYSWSGLLFDFSIMFIIFVFYAVVGYMTNVKQNSSKIFFLFPSGDVWFSGLLGLLLAMLILIALYHYLSNNRYLGEMFDDKRLLPFVTQHFYSYYQHFSDLKEYQFYYYQVNGDDKVVFMFRIKANRCVVLGNPLGESKYYKEAVEDFIKYLDICNYQAVFYNIDQEFSLLLHDLGYQFMKISELGINDDNNMSNHMSKFTKCLNINEIYQNLNTLKEISDNDINQNNRGFSLARYTREFVLSSTVLVHYDNHHNIVSYCTLSQPVDNQVSLMYIHSIDNNLDSDFMKDILSWCHKNHYVLSLGYSPLANVGVSQFSFFEERLINILYNYGNNKTAFEKTYNSLQQYTTCWKSGYLAYPNHQNFFIIIIQISILIFKKSKSKDFI